jgi:hypothetical protein
MKATIRQDVVRGLPRAVGIDRLSETRCTHGASA